MKRAGDDLKHENLNHPVPSFKTRIFGSLRFRLLLLVALAIVPIVGLILFSAWDRRQAAEDRARQDAIDLTNLAVLQQDQTVDGSRQLLVILAGLTRAANLETIEPAACDGVLLGFLNEFTSYEEIGIALPDGNIVCSALPVETPLNVHDESWFQRTLDTRAFSVGDYQVSRITNNPTVNVGYPVFDETDTIKAVLFLSFHLDWLNTTVASASLPESADFVLFDRQGVILARHPDDGSSVGENFAVGVSLLNLPDRPTNVLEAAGEDGVDRLYGFTAASQLDERGLFAAVGVPTSTAFADINTDLRRNLVGLAIVALLAFAAAWLIGDLLVLRHTRDLVDVSYRLAAGDFSARSRFAGGQGELDVLGRAFDDMATALERREAEREEVEASQRRAAAAEERDRFKTFLLSTVSHELRTPISVIKGFASTLKEYGDRLSEEERTEYWDSIITYSDRLDSMVSDLLLISNAEAGRLPLSVGSIEVVPFINEVIRSYQHVNPGRQFAVEGRATTSLMADRSRVRQVLDNLIGNAIKYAPADSPIEVHALEFNGEVSLSVRDHGPGVPEESLETIFDPFARGANADQQSVQGYGLGLAICRAIVQAHRGRIWASLPEGGGLAVTFTLPATML